MRRVKHSLSETTTPSGSSSSAVLGCAWHQRNVVTDFNMLVCGLLDDKAAAQSSIYARRAYERSARSVALLPHPLPDMAAAALAAWPHMGKSAMRVVNEALATASGRSADIAPRQALREGFLSMAVARQVLDQAAPRVVGRRHYLADFQMHSLWSDGAQSIAEMALGCSERGYTHFAVTDHARGLTIARGLSAESMHAQHREIDTLNESLDGKMRVLKGIEANILADGRLDVSADEMRRCDIVLAAPHSRLDEPGDQTDRLMAVVKTAGVHVLAHPSGRKFGKRAGLNVRWDRLFKEAARRNVAIELDGDPSRQDLSFALVCQALDAGCVFAIDSDAHTTEELVFSEIALAHARLAGVPPSRVINCWPLKKLLAWLRSHQQ